MHLCFYGERIAKRKERCRTSPVWHLPAGQPLCWSAKISSRGHGTGRCVHVFTVCNVSYVCVAWYGMLWIVPLGIALCVFAVCFYSNSMEFNDSEYMKVCRYDNFTVSHFKADLRLVELCECISGKILHIQDERAAVWLNGAGFLVLRCHWFLWGLLLLPLSSYLDFNVTGALHCNDHCW